MKWSGSGSVCRVTPLVPSAQACRRGVSKTRFTRGDLEIEGSVAPEAYFRNATYRKAVSFGPQVSFLLFFSGLVIHCILTNINFHFGVRSRVRSCSGPHNSRLLLELPPLHPLRRLRSYPRQVQPRLHEILGPVSRTLRTL